jgi:hypothetical protein
LYEGTPKSKAETVTIELRNPINDFPAEPLIQAATLFMFPGSWEISMTRVDNKDVVYKRRIETLAGVHTVSGIASQGIAGIVAFWRCRGSIEFDFYPGSFEFAFNYDYESPILRINDTASGATVATGACQRVGVWSGREIKDERKAANRS